MRLILMVLAALMGLSISAEAQTIDSALAARITAHDFDKGPFPTRVVPDTRNIVYVFWSNDVVIGLQDMWNASAKSGKEVGGCVYGGTVGFHTVVLTHLESPKVVNEQTESTVGFECRQADNFLGDVHTHPLRHEHPSDIDNNSFEYADGAYMIVVVAPTKAILVNREMELLPFEWSPIQ